MVFSVTASRWWRATQWRPAFTIHSRYFPAPEASRIAAVALPTSGVEIANRYGCAGQNEHGPGTTKWPDGAARSLPRQAVCKLVLQRQKTLNLGEQLLHHFALVHQLHGSLERRHDLLGGVDAEGVADRGVDVRHVYRANLRLCTVFV